MMGIKKIAVLTGAGISAESGLKTFRGTDGLWDGHRVEDVATPDAWRRDPAAVQRFYNERRNACLKANPNAGHYALTDLENYADVHIVTQNIDDLHERAGSKNILHLHGEIIKSQSSLDPNLIYEIKGNSIEMGDRCELGSQLRPHVVWFGEPVPNMVIASEVIKKADILLVIGTSLQVYPAANLIYETEPRCPIIVVDPNSPQIKESNRQIKFIRETAATALPKLINDYIKNGTFDI